MAATLNVKNFADIYNIFVSMIPRNCLTYLYKLTARFMKLFIIFSYFVKEKNI